VSLLAVETTHRRWHLGFVLWAAAGFLVSFGLIAVLTIGFPFVVAGTLLSVWSYRRGPGWPADLGLIAGVGVMCLTIAVIQAIVGHLDPTVWALVGGVLLAASSFAFWWLRCRPGTD
jgi:hypothetical protein